MTETPATSPKRFAAIALLLLLAPAAPATADDGFLPEGLYVGLGGGVIGTRLLSDDKGVAGIASARIGIPFAEVSAFEVQGDWIPEDDAYVVTVQQRIPIFFDFGPIAPFLVAGIGWGSVDDSTHFASRVGGGIDYSVTEQITIGIDVTHVFQPKSVTDYTSFGVAARYAF